MYLVTSYLASYAPAFPELDLFWTLSGYDSESVMLENVVVCLSQKRSGSSSVEILKL